MQIFQNDQSKKNVTRRKMPKKEAANNVTEK